MPAIESAARRYAQAAFELAGSSGTDLEAWAAGLDAIAEFTSEVDIKRVLEATRVPQTTKMQLIGAGLGDQPRLVQNMARLLVRKGRSFLAPDIARSFGELLDAQKGIEHATASTAVALTAAETEALRQTLRARTGKDVILETKVDPSLLGGVVIQIGDKLIDASTRARLRALRESLVGAV